MKCWASYKMKKSWALWVLLCFAGVPFGCGCSGGESKPNYPVPKQSTPEELLNDPNFPEYKKKALRKQQGEYAKDAVQDKK